MRTLWKEKLTEQHFGFPGASYNSFSRYAKELGAHAGGFVGELVALAADKDEFVRANAAALVVYALAEDDGKAVPVKPLDRAVLVVCLAKSARDADHLVRLSAVMAMKRAGGRWAVPVLEQMHERELSFHPRNASPAEWQPIRGQIELAIQAICSRPGSRRRWQSKDNDYSWVNHPKLSVGHPGVRPDGRRRSGNPVNSGYRSPASQMREKSRSPKQLSHPRPCRRYPRDEHRQAEQYARHLGAWLQSLCSTAG